MHRHMKSPIYGYKVHQKRACTFNITAEGENLALPHLHLLPYSHKFGHPSNPAPFYIFFPQLAYALDYSITDLAETESLRTEYQKSLSTAVNS